MNAKHLRLIVIVLLMFAPGVQAETGVKLLAMDVDLSDTASLQRGARIFVNYCLGCHSANYMRYNRMGMDLGISDDILKKNFIFGDAKVGETMGIAMNKEDAIRYWGGVAPPDLSVIARSRGADYLYTYFKTFYLDDTRPFGVNNLVKKNASMPHVLWGLQGMQALVGRHDKGKAQHSHAVTDLKLVTPGTQTPEEYDQTVKDLVNFLVYMGEPIQLKRNKIGVWVMLYLIIFAIIAYMLKKEYWRDVH